MLLLYEFAYSCLHLNTPCTEMVCYYLVCDVSCVQFLEIHQLHFQQYEKKIDPTLLMFFN